MEMRAGRGAGASWWQNGFDSFMCARYTQTIFGAPALKAPVVIVWLGGVKEGGHKSEGWRCGGERGVAASDLTHEARK